jgi:hypothetical protein
VNVVADALSRKSQGRVEKSEPTLDQLAQQIGMIQLDTRPTNRDVSLATLVILPTLADQIKLAQEKDPELEKLK